MEHRSRRILSKTWLEPTIKSLSLLLLAVVAFYWKIIFTSQFSMMTDSETVTQAYSWFHFGGRCPLAPSLLNNSPQNRERVNYARRRLT